MDYTFTFDGHHHNLFTSLLGIGHYEKKSYKCDVLHDCLTKGNEVRKVQDNFENFSEAPYFNKKFLDGKNEDFVHNLIVT